MGGWVDLIMRGEIQFFIGVGIGAVVGDLVIGISIGIVLGAALSQFNKPNREIEYTYNFDLIAKIPKELKGKSNNIEVENWFNQDNDEYKIFNQIDIDFDYCEEDDLKFGEEEFIIGIQVEKGDATHSQYLYEHIKNVLRKFKSDYNTKWEGQFYIDDGKDDYICYAQDFELQLND